MNDRILELAVQAELYVDWNGRPYPRAMSAEECRAAYAKFAELIIADTREACAKICDSYAENQKSWSYGEDDSAEEYRAQAANELADTIRESWNI
jgi:hypothetical protein